AHIGQKLRFSEISGLRPGAGFIGGRLFPLELLNKPVLLSDKVVLLRPVLEHRKSGTAQGLNKENEIKVDASANNRQEPKENFARQDKAKAKRHRNWNGASMKDR